MPRFSMQGLNKSLSFARSPAHGSQNQVLLLEIASPFLPSC